MNATDHFDGLFSAFCGVPSPLRWQRRLFAGFVQGRVPQICDLPTGLGKTSVIPIWLIALAHSAQTNGASRKLPRRLVYIVNRRTVVDQATDHAKRLLALIYRSGQLDHMPWASDEAIAELGLSKEAQVQPEHAPLVGALRKTLSSLCARSDVPPLAVSTLRGELADNGEWKTDPARPAIIVGTVDMIGSKLLFSGYGDGRNARARHAGLIGQDTLIVHDEAHLSPAFSRLLWTVEREQRQGGDPRPISVLELTATSRDDAETTAVRQAVWSLRGTEGDPVFSVAAEDGADSVVRRRLTARKKLTVEACDGGKGELIRAITAKALTYRDSKARVLVYVRSPEDAKEIASALTNAKSGLGPDAEHRVALLTGTIRGHERDKLAATPLFREFKSRDDRPPPEQTLYLICTSAGEVGVDFDADHLICDLTTLDSMAQRFGRVNRMGGKERCADVTVFRGSLDANITEKKKEAELLASAIAQTAHIMENVAANGRDVSPGALAEILCSSDAAPALSPHPMTLPATDILFDSWALTSITGALPGRPEVGTYLHGTSQYDPPETYIAWRAEINDLARVGVTEDDLAEMLEVFPLRTAERLKDRVDRVQHELEGIAARHPDARVILIRDGEPQWAALGDLAPTQKAEKERARRMLAYATVILPAEVGGLRSGMLDGQSEEPVLDVAEISGSGQVARQRVRVNQEAEAALLGGELLAAPFRWVVRLRGAEDPDEDVSAETIEYRVAKGEDAEPGTPVLLAEHLGAVETRARSITRALRLPGDVAEAVGLAAHWHDRGKARERWQRYACNKDLDQPLGKSGRYANPRVLGGYRHEFGSLHEASVDTEIAVHPERDLILHLISAHHGWGRPHFRREPRGRADDPARTTDENQREIIEAARRFARVQRRFGRWGLAWLESLLRCADAIASDLPNQRGEV